MIERNAVNENALEITSRTHTVRMLVRGDKMFFSATDILKACGIKAPGKWIARNVNDRPDIITQRFEYPMRTAQGYRKVKMIFVTGAGGKRLVKSTACPDETKRWLTEEVLTYRTGKPAPDDTDVEADAEPKTEDRTPGTAEINRRIDSILLELLEIKRSLAADASGS